MVNYLEWTTDGQFSQTRIEETNVPGHLEIVQQVFIKETIIHFKLIIGITKEGKSSKNYITIYYNN